jgi:hypothetical protein
MAEDQKDPIAKYDELLGPRDYTVAPGLVFVCEPMLPGDWGETIGAIPTLPDRGGDAAAMSRDNLARQQAMYKKIYETKVKGLRVGDQIVPRPHDRMLAGHVQQLGEFILGISGIGGARAEAAGRSLPE